MLETNMPEPAKKLAKKVYDKVVGELGDYGASLTALNYVSNNYNPVLETKSVDISQMAYDYDPERVLLRLC